MKVSLVIPNWNGADKLKNNLPEVLKTKGVDQFIVVDDRSTDNSIEVIRSFPEVVLIERSQNGGFSSAVNTGVAAAEGELVFVLNSDAVPEPDCLKFVLPHFKDEQLFSVGANVGGNWSWASFKDGWFWHRQAPPPLPTEAHPTMWASGGSGVFRKSMWDQLNGLDELFNPFYEEDLDIGYRALKRGWMNLWEPKFQVEHYKQKGVIAQNFSKSKVSRVAERNHLIFIWKNITSPELISQHRWALAKQVLTHPKYWSTLLDAMSRLPSVLKLRQIEINQQKLTDEQILAKYQV